MPVSRRHRPEVGKGGGGGLPLFPATLVRGVVGDPTDALGESPSSGGGAGRGLLLPPLL